MKNYFIAIALAGALGCFAQQVQNANWYFGYNIGLHFLPNPQNPTVFSTGLQSIEGCASYSDQQGNLIFYSNGIQAFNSNNTLMPNGSGLMGHTSSTNSVILIPKPFETPVVQTLAEVPIPPNKGSIYLVTIDGNTGAKKGLYYSEIIHNNDNTAQISSNKNIVLKDHNGININASYGGIGNMSEKITSAPHCNGRDYWLIAYIGSNIYSYLVTPQGISPTPSAVSSAPVNIQINLPYLPGQGQIKVNRNNSRIAVCYGILQNQLYGALALGDFNSSTGQVSFDGNLISVPPIQSTDPDAELVTNYIYGAEFSPNNRYVYFSMGQHIYRAIAEGDTSDNIQQISVYPVLFREGLQLAYNGKIYIGSADNNDNFIISVINNPDEPVNYDFADDVIYTQNKMRCSFPQWVHWQMGNCTPSYTFSLPDLNILPYKYKAGNFITTNNSYSVNSNQNIQMTAANYIEMLPNTTIEAGSRFLAEIGPCVDCDYQPVPKSNKQTFSSDNIETGEPLKLVMYPNPSKDYVTLSVLNQTVKYVSVTNTAGREIFSGKNDSREFTLNVSSYQKGIYLVNVITKEGGNYVSNLIVE